MDLNGQKQERFQYINLFKIDYKYKIFKGIFDTSNAISTLLENEIEKEKNFKKKEKSIISSNNKISKKEAKQIQKKNAKKRKNEENEKKEEELMLEK